MMKHLLTAIACCLAVAGSAQIEYLPDSISHKPGYILFEPCGGPTYDQFVDSVVAVMYGSYDSIPDYQDPPQPGFYGFVNSGLGGCSEDWNSWADVGLYWDHVMNGNLWGTPVQELMIPQFGSEKYLFDLYDFSENFNVWEHTCLKAYYLFPRNSIGGGENWRLTHQQVNQCNILSVSTWSSPPCPDEETPQQFFFESSTNSDLDGWYIVQDAGSWVGWLDHPDFVPTEIEAIGQSCVGCSGCTDVEACNYYPYDITDNANCDYEGCHRGCMDVGACNYDAMALFDNGQCTYPDPGHTCDGTLATAFCGEGTVWSDALQQCMIADPTPVEEACLGDLDGDGLRAVSDLLLFLSVFGEPCSDSDDEAADWPHAILFIESSADAQLVGNAEEDLLTYMFEGAPFQEWWGWSSTGPPDLSNSNVVADFLYWMDWPGFVDGTLNAPPAQLVAIPQEDSNGTDFIGNVIEDFKFLTTEFEILSPVGSNLQFVAVTPRVMNNGSMLRYSSIGFDWTGSPVGSSYQTTGVSGASMIDIDYLGDIWPNTTYRIHSNSGSLNHNVYPGSGPCYFRGGNYLLE